MLGLDGLPKFEMTDVLTRNELDQMYLHRLNKAYEDMLSMDPMKAYWDYICNSDSSNESTT